MVLHPHEKPNAFAFPGGGIGVTKGLLEALEREVEFAFVIGHELGHFHNRDHLRGLGRALGTSVCLSIIFGGTVGGDVMTSNTMFIINRKYSRDQEKAADRFGMKLVYDVYGKTEGVEKLFELLEKKDKLPAWAYMLATHPKPGDRIADLKRYAEALEKEKSASP